MKKWASLSCAFILGVIVASSAGTVAAKVQSLVGQKVTEELKVVINGKELADKGAVINGKTNAPVRAITDAIGGTLKLEGKTINITTGNETSTDSNSANSEKGQNPFIGQSKVSLEKIKKALESDTLKVLESERNQIKAMIEQSKSSGGGEITQKAIEAAEKNLATYDADIEKYSKQLEQINEALQALEK
jgi:hypothetical protein